jgi:hypothetical protein
LEFSSPKCRIAVISSAKSRQLAPKRPADAENTASAKRPRQFPGDANDFADADGNGSSKAKSHSKVVRYKEVSDVFTSNEEPTQVFRNILPSTSNLFAGGIKSVHAQFSIELLSHLFVSHNYIFLTSVSQRLCMRLLSTDQKVTERTTQTRANSN